jgi:hypothetical protein
MTEPQKVWIVRDTHEGELMPYVSVWCQRPQRYVIGSDVQWLAESSSDYLDGWLGSVFLPDAWRLFGTTPDDDRQVIVAERDHREVYDAIAASVQLAKP